MTERMKQKLTSFMVSAMMAFLGSASPALLASDTASPKDLKQGSGVNSTTWCTLVTSKPCSRHHLRRVVANKIFSPFILPIKLRRGWAMMLCFPALVCMKSPISSRLFSVFLKMGHISLNFSFKCWGTRIFTSTHPNERPFRTSIKIRPGLIILIVSKVLRTSVAIKRCSSWVVLFICRHSHSHISTTNILGVGSGFFQQLTHGFVSFVVKLFSAVERTVMAVPITPVELIHSLRLRVETVYR